MSALFSAHRDLFFSSAVFRVHTEILREFSARIPVARKNGICEYVVSGDGNLFLLRMMSCRATHQDEGETL